LIDSTIKYYSIMGVGNDTHFHSFLGLCSGDDIAIDSSNKSIFISFCREVENYELYCLICQHFESDSQTVDNAMSRYFDKQSFYHLNIKTVEIASARVDSRNGPHS
jgi:hypothetical protein